MSIQPLEDRVLIQPESAEEKTAAGIYLPDSAQEKPMWGKVVAVGPGKRNDDGVQTPLTVKKGDTVVYGKYAGTEVDGGDDTLVILRESDLLAKIEK